MKKWRVLGEAKETVAKNKERIQREFKTKMGLIVDKPKPGFGNSNDGNTARRFFADPDKASLITGVDKDLIIKFHIILATVSSGHTINLEKC